MVGITSELREYVNQTPVPKSRTLMKARDRFNAIADRIDQRVAELLREQDADFRAEIDLLNDERTDGWVELPKDADGEYIHMGDRMENGEMVARIVLTDGSWEPTVYTAATPNQLHEYYCHNIRHHRPDTWERIEEDARKAMSLYSMPHVVMTLIERCKALAKEMSE